MRRPARRGLAAGLAVFAALIALVIARQARQRAPAPPPPPGVSSLPNVLLITVDTLRPDALGWVAGRNPTPAIDALARGSFRLPAAVAPVPLTLPSHAALLTGQLPRRLGLRDNGQVVGAVPTLAEALAARGYQTGACVSGAPLLTAFGLDRGFQHYDDELPDGPEGERERLAPHTTAAALAWLRDARPPWFLWVHYYDPHFPYEPPADLRRPGPRGAYDGEVAAVDRAIGELRAGLSGPTLTVFAADHGESLGEHGEGTHGFFVYDATVAVPLLFHFPGRIAAAKSAAPARLWDVTPTVLELLALPPLPAVDGRSLVPLLEGRATAWGPAYVETWQPWTSYGWAPLRAVRDGGWKLIEAPQPELYDLAADPGESRNLFATQPEKAGALERALRQAMPPTGEPRPATGDQEAIQQLRALGYLGAAASAPDPPARGLRDPKDGQELRDRLTAGDAALRRGDPAAALAAFEAVLAEDPGNRFALVRSGVALDRAGQGERAVARLRRAVELQPGDPEARQALAETLMRLRRHREAVPEWHELIRLQPRRADHWSGLGNALGLAGDARRAKEAFERAVDLRPGDTDLVTRLAFAAHAAGDLAAAARHLEEAARLAPAEFAHAGALGILLVELGRPQEALPWLRASRPEEGDYARARAELARLEPQRAEPR
jgi:choline-sulfatase